MWASSLDAASRLVEVRGLAFRRQRSAIVAVIGVGVLSAPWGVFLIGPDR